MRRMKENNIIVSIIIPCYNAIDYLADILSDIKAQTYQYIETIIVSNGVGQEAQVKLAEELTKDLMWSQVIHTDVGGVSNARNLGLKAAKGEWVCFIDADDRIKPEHVQLFVDAITDDLDVIEGGFEHVDINGQSSQVLYSNKFFDLSIGQNGLYKEGMMSNINKIGNAPWNKMFRRWFLIENKLDFDTRFSMNEDRIFAMSALLCARKWKFIPMTGYIYKASRGSAMSRFHKNVEDSWNTYLDLKDKIKLRCGYNKDDICQDRLDMQYYLVWQYIWNMFKPGCPYSFSTKVKKIQMMMADQTFVSSCDHHNWGRESMRYKFFYRCIQTGSPLLVALLFWSQHYGKQIINFFKQ